MNINEIKPNQPLTMAQVQQLHQDGFPVLIGEYRLGKAENIEWRDKTSKQMVSGVSVRHTVENAVESVVISENVPDGYDVAKFLPPCKKGDKCAYIARSMQTAKGVVQFRGTVHPLSRK